MSSFSWWTANGICINIISTPSDKTASKSLAELEFTWLKEPGTDFWNSKPKSNRHQHKQKWQREAEGNYWLEKRYEFSDCIWWGKPSKVCEWQNDTDEWCDGCVVRKYWTKRLGCRERSQAEIHQKKLFRKGERCQFWHCVSKAALWTNSIKQGIICCL